MRKSTALLSMVGREKENKYQAISIVVTAV